MDVWVYSLEVEMQTHKALWIPHALDSPIPRLAPYSKIETRTFSSVSNMQRN